MALLHPGSRHAATILRSIVGFGPPDMSAREFLERRGDRGRARLLSEMTLAAHLPGSVDEIGMFGVVTDGVHRLETGLNRRAAEGYDRLAAFVGRGLDIRFGFVVETVRWRADEVSLWSIDGRELRARTAICTLPAGVLSADSVRFEPELPDGKISALRDLQMGRVLKILLRFRERFWPRRLAILACGGYSFVRVGRAGARERLAAADTGALLWAGAATESSPIAETVEAAYLSGLRAASEARSLLSC